MVISERWDSGGLSSFSQRNLQMIFKYSMINVLFLCEQRVNFSSNFKIIHLVVDKIRQCTSEQTSMEKEEHFHFFSALNNSSTISVLTLLLHQGPRDRFLVVQKLCYKIL